MREIKFRIWNITLQRMSKPKTMQELIETAMYEEARGLKVSENYDNLILMQYTGLKDKNGKEIYEDDLIQISGIGIGEVVYGFHITSKDDWSVEHGTMGFTLKWTGTDDHTELHSSKELEIIGNVYENPKLLKEKT